MRITKKVLDETTQHKPRSRSPQYRKWRRLHAKHLEALRANRLADACDLADAKYRLYEAAWKWWMTQLTGKSA